MRSNAKRIGVNLFLLLLLIGLLPLSLSAAKDSDYIVKNLKVEDIPYDDGSGLKISWQPLPKEKRIIQYRVYRGTSADSLFLIGTIQVNVKTGVSGDVMYYYDKDYNEFVDIQSPGKLKKERKQPAGSPLYRSIPRDLNITGPMLTKYNILGVVNKDEIYFRTHPYDYKEKDEVTKMAGLKVAQIMMVKKLLPDLPYYYTVVAVDEANRFYPYASIAKGIARENLPESPAKFYSVFVKDKGKLQFEWEFPLYKDDILYTRIYAIAKTQIAQFTQYVAQNNKMLIDTEMKILDPKYQILPSKPVANPGILIHNAMTAIPYAYTTTAIIDISKGVISDPAAQINATLNPADIDKYQFVLSVVDIAGKEVFSTIPEVDVITSNQLPELPEVSITDKDNDKGDYITVSWGKPVVYLTKVSFADNSKKVLILNYDYISNKLYKLTDIDFEFYDESGVLISKVNEFFLDKKIFIKFKEAITDLEKKKYTVKIKIKCNKDVGADYAFTQALVYDKVLKSLRPDDIKLKNEVLKDYRYYIYKRLESSEIYRLAKSVGGTQREIDDNIRYETVYYKGVEKYDAKKQLLLVDNGTDFTYDKENKVAMRTVIYLSEIKKETDKINKNIKKYQTMMDTLKTESDKMQCKTIIGQYEKQLKLIQSNKLMQQANALTSDKARMKFIAKVRESEKRTFAYKFVKTDGKGHFIEIEYVDKDGKLAYFLPQSNWFYKDKIPMLIATLLFGLILYVMIGKAKKGHDLYIRPIAGIQEIDNAIGRATEMGRPILFVPGLSGISDVATLAGLSILGRVAKKCAEYDTKILVPCRDYIVLPIAQEIVREAHYEAGRPDTFDRNNIFFLTDAQFAFVAGVNGIMIREKTATNFYMGMFYAEALIMTETGSSTGAIQIAGTDAVTQIPFFITTCDYTLIGQELYAASAYMAREPLMLGSLKASDYASFLIMVFVVCGTILSTSHLTFLIQAFPEK